MLDDDPAVEPLLFPKSAQVVRNREPNARGLPGDGERAAGQGWTTVLGEEQLVPGTAGQAGQPADLHLERVVATLVVAADGEAGASRSQLPEAVHLDRPRRGAPGPGV